MKLSKWETGILVLSALFLAFTAGWLFRGAGRAEPLRVETQRRLSENTVSLPAATGPAEVERINVNTAGVEELKNLPGIGEKRASDIVADREANGPFRFPEELTRVKGIGEETVAGCLEYITTEDVSP